MPYEKRTKGNRICVYKKTTGKKLSCYSGDDAEKRADDYLAALNANMPEEEKENIVVAKESDIDAFLAFKGGPGSGNKGHAGIKGHKGGSAPGGGGGMGNGGNASITIDNVSIYQRNMLRTLEGKSSSQTEFMQWISGPVFRTLMSAGLAKRRKKYSFTGSLIDSQGKYDEYGAMLTKAGRKLYSEIKDRYGRDFER